MGPSLKNISQNISRNFLGHNLNYIMNVWWMKFIHDDVNNYVDDDLGKSDGHDVNFDVEDVIHNN